MKSLTTLHLSSLDLKIGKGRVSIYLPLKGMVDRGYIVTYISSFPYLSTGERNGILCKYVWCPFANSRLIWQWLSHPLADLIYIFAGIKEAKKNHPDIVYAHCVHTALAAIVVAKLFHAKSVIRLYGIGKGINDKWHHFPSYLMKRRCMKLNADAYILTNDGTAADKFAIKMGVPKEKIHFLKNGINKDIDITPNNMLRRQYADDDERIVLSLSRLSNSKQVDLIIKMMPSLLKQTKAKLLIIGNGEEWEKLHKLTSELGVKQYVVFLGVINQKDVYQYINISDVFVSLNNLSSMSNPVFEAMTCGKAVVALNRGTTKDLIHDKENGIIIEPKDISNLPNIVSGLLNDDIERKRIGENARNFMLREWPTWEKRVQQEIDIITNLK